jgi:L-lactate permease
MDYSTLLSDDQKRELLVGRIQQFAAEAYQHSLNLKVAQLTGDTNAQEIATTSIAALDQALQVHTEELATIDATTPPTPAPSDPNNP